MTKFPFSPIRPAYTSINCRSRLSTSVELFSIGSNSRESLRYIFRNILTLSTFPTPSSAQVGLESVSTFGPGFTANTHESAEPLQSITDFIIISWRG